MSHPDLRTRDWRILVLGLVKLPPTGYLWVLETSLAPGPACLIALAPSNELSSDARPAASLASLLEGQADSTKGETVSASLLLGSSAIVLERFEVVPLLPRQFRSHRPNQVAEIYEEERAPV